MPTAPAPEWKSPESIAWELLLGGRGEIAAIVGPDCLTAAKRARQVCRALFICPAAWPEPRNCLGAEDARALMQLVPTGFAPSGALRSLAACRDSISR